jgi:hypothetical protein
MRSSQMKTLVSTADLRAKFEPGTSRARSIRANHSAAMYVEICES